MSFLKKLFGGGASSETSDEANVVEYEGYSIIPTPQREGGQYRLCARVEKEIGGELKTHHLIRADTIGGLEAAEAASVSKAKQIIDEQGDGMFR